MIETTEDRGVGQGYPPGETRAAIVSFLVFYPDGIEEPKIRDWLREKYGLKQKKTIITHLTVLKEEGLLTLQHSPGKSNIWKLNPSQKTQIFICKAALESDIKALVLGPLSKDKENEDRISLFGSEYVQRAIDTTFLPLFKKRYYIDTSLEEMLPNDLMTFIEKGFKMSPTAVIDTLIPLHLVHVAVGLFIAALDRTQEIDNVTQAVVTLYACLLTDLTKYCLCQGVEDKIMAFLSEPRIISAISEWVGWDFTEVHKYPLLPTNLPPPRMIERT
jgi:hypothetical protein